VGQTFRSARKTRAEAAAKERKDRKGRWVSAMKECFVGTFFAPFVYAISVFFCGHEGTQLFRLSELLQIVESSKHGKTA
jgi:hypothetical protein